MRLTNTKSRIGRMQGFTIIELMIALVIMAVLTSLATPIYQDYTVRAKVAEAYGVVSALKLSVEDYYISNGERFPPCTAAEYSNVDGDCTKTVGTPIITKYVESTRIGPEGVIEVTLDAGIIQALDSSAQGGAVENVIRFVPMTRTPVKNAGGDAVTDYNPTTAGNSGVIAWKCVTGQFTATIVDQAGTSAIPANGVVAKFSPGECKN